MVKNLKVGDEFHFKGMLLDGKTFDSSQIKGTKVISFFPKLNTKICDFQTLKMLEWSKKYPNTTFISTSMDPISVAKEWCQAHKVDNLFFVSDENYRDFATKTGFYLEDKKVLKRGLMLIDENQIIQVITVNPELSEEPHYEVISQKLKM